MQDLQPAVSMSGCACCGFEPRHTCAAILPRVHRSPQDRSPSQQAGLPRFPRPAARRPTMVRHPPERQGGHPLQRVCVRANAPAPPHSVPSPVPRTPLGVQHPMPPLSAKREATSGAVPCFDSHRPDRIPAGERGSPRSATRPSARVHPTVPEVTPSPHPPEEGDGLRGVETRPPTRTRSDQGAQASSTSAPLRRPPLWFFPRRFPEGAPAVPVRGYAQGVQPTAPLRPEWRHPRQHARQTAPARCRAPVHRHAHPPRHAGTSTPECFRRALRDAHRCDHAGPQVEQEQGPPLQRVRLYGPEQAGRPQGDPCRSIRQCSLVLSQPAGTDPWQGDGALQPPAKVHRPVAS